MADSIQKKCHNLFLGAAMRRLKTSDRNRIY